MCAVRGAACGAPERHDCRAQGLLPAPRHPRLRTRLRAEPPGFALSAPGSVALCAASPYPPGCRRPGSDPTSAGTPALPRALTAPATSGIWMNAQNRSASISWASQLRSPRAYDSPWRPVPFLPRTTCSVGGRTRVRREYQGAAGRRRGGESPVSRGSAARRGGGGHQGRGAVGEKE